VTAWPVSVEGHEQGGCKISARLHREEIERDFVTGAALGRAGSPIGTETECARKWD
jgi:hypothetical protein